MRHILTTTTRLLPRPLWVGAGTDIPDGMADGMVAHTQAGVRDGMTARVRAGEAVSHGVGTAARVRAGPVDLGARPLAWVDHNRVDPAARTPAWVGHNRVDLVDPAARTPAWVGHNRVDRVAEVDNRSAPCYGLTRNKSCCLALTPTELPRQGRWVFAWSPADRLSGRLRRQEIANEIVCIVLVQDQIRHSRGGGFEALIRSYLSERVTR
jgi:hypothetical protein